MEKSNERKTVHTVFWETSDFLSAFAITMGFAFEMRYPTTLDLINHILLGIVIWLVGIAIILFSKSEFSVRKQKSGPGHVPHKLITTGIFKYSRNPIYVGMVIIVAGLGVAFDSWWMIGSSLLALILMHFILVRPEEKFLLEEFGEKFKKYKKQVRPWI